MKSVVYTSLNKLGCGCPPVDVILCMDPSVMADAIPFLEATLINMDCGNSFCGQTKYSYTFTYDEALLLDPNVPLESCNITGVFCNNCLAEYMAWRCTSPFISSEGDEYIYVMPAGPPPMPNGQPFALDVVSVAGHVVTLGWHSAAVVP